LYECIFWDEALIAKFLLP